MLVVMVLGGAWCASEARTQESVARLVYTANTTGNFEIWTARADGSHERQLTCDPSYESWWPRIAPDGAAVLFYRSPRGTKDNDYKRASLWRCEASGANPRVLIGQGAYGWSAQGVVDWSPSGTRLVMAATAQGRWHLFVTDRDGHSPQRISRRQGLYADPSWSPDGRYLVFCAFPPDYKGIDLARLEVYMAKADGSQERRLTFDNYRDHDPYWSPDGRTIAFESAVKPFKNLVGQWALRVVDLKSGRVETLLDDGHIHSVPRWHPTSASLVFHRLRFGIDKQFNLWRIARDGTGLRCLTPASERFQRHSGDYYRSTGR